MKINLLIMLTLFFTANGFASIIRPKMLNTAEVELILNTYLSGQQIDMNSMAGLYQYYKKNNLSSNVNNTVAIVNGNKVYITLGLESISLSTTPPTN